MKRKFIVGVLVISLLTVSFMSSALAASENFDGYTFTYTNTKPSGDSIYAQTRYSAPKSTINVIRAVATIYYLGSDNKIHSISETVSDDCVNSVTTNTIQLPNLVSRGSSHFVAHGINTISRSLS